MIVTLGKKAKAGSFPSQQLHEGCASMNSIHQLTSQNHKHTVVAIIQQTVR